MKYFLFVFAILALTACEDKERPFMTVECYDKHDKIVFKSRVHEFSAQAAMPGKGVLNHTCIITGDDQSQ